MAAMSRLRSSPPAAALEVLGADDRLARASGTDRRLVGRSLLTVASRAAAGGVQLLFLVAAGRLLSLEEFAAYSYLLALAVIFSMFGETGVGVVGSRDVVAGRLALRDVFWSSLPVAVLAALAASLVLVAVGAVDSGPGSTLVPVMLAGLFVVANRLLEFLATLLRSTGRYELEAGLKVGSAVLFVVGSVAAAALGLGVTALLAVLLLKELLAALWAFGVLRRDVGRPMAPVAAVWRTLLRGGAQVTVASAGLLVMTRGPLFYLGNSTDDTADLAHYSAVLRFADAAFLLATAAGFALLPGLAFLAASEPARVRKLLGKVFAGLVGGSAVVALVAVPLARPLCELVYGSAYGPAADAGRVLLAGLPVYTAVGVLWFALLALDSERAVLLLALVSAGAGLIAAALLVPGLGSVGASWAYLAAHVPLCVGGAWVLARRVGDLRPAAP
jgi:PST family polysaccharide transporter